MYCNRRRSFIIYLLTIPRNREFLFHFGRYRDTFGFTDRKNLKLIIDIGACVAIRRYWHFPSLFFHSSDEHPRSLIRMI